MFVHVFATLVLAHLWAARLSPLHVDYLWAMETFLSEAPKPAFAGGISRELHPARSSLTLSFCSKRLTILLSTRSFRQIRSVFRCDSGWMAPTSRNRHGRTRTPAAS